MGAPRIEVVRDAGACFGVERALTLVRKTAAQSASPVVTLGPLIHNRRVVSDLADEGIASVEDPRDAPPGATLVLRTHGVTPQTEELAARLGLSVLDATCPFVKNVHKAAERLAELGYDIVVAGEDAHPEVEGTLGHVPGAQAIGSAEEAASATLGRRVGVVVQTTLETDVLADIVSGLVGRVDELVVRNTICDATSRRQAAAADAARRSDVMIVVGGRHSANTRHLFDICARRCKKTYHVEDESEVDADWFVDVQRIGITAGASTPQDHINQVHARIEELTCIP